ncbi:YaeP family protein [Photobacterium leiognathi]|uniref:YaeP family protein n=1 Tax=Photobacterium leiognathi TaxID=553611 RepID=UPI002738E95B|nr:YaeP family protein [Photobacterium leiognathi]
MQVYQCGELIRATYAQIGSGDQGHIPAAIACAIKTFNDIAENTSLPLEVRERAAFAAANLLISDHEDK